MYIRPIYFQQNLKFSCEKCLGIINVPLNYEVACDLLWFSVSEFARGECRGWDCCLNTWTAQNCSIEEFFHGIIRLENFLVRCFVRRQSFCGSSSWIKQKPRLNQYLGDLWSNEPSLWYTKDMTICTITLSVRTVLLRECRIVQYYQRLAEECGIFRDYATLERALSLSSSQQITFSLIYCKLGGCIWSYSREDV